MIEEINPDDFVKVFASDVEIAREYEEKDMTIEQINAEIVALTAMQVEFNFRVKLLDVKKEVKGLRQ